MSELFCRRLADELVITVDGVLELDRDITERQPARVVVTMPDYVADALAHVLADFSRVADIFDDLNKGIDSVALAHALYGAATTGDYRCPDDGLRLAVEAEEPMPA